MIVENELLYRTTFWSAVEFTQNSPADQKVFLYRRVDEFCFVTDDFRVFGL